MRPRTDNIGADIKTGKYQDFCFRLLFLLHGNMVLLMNGKDVSKTSMHAGIALKMYVLLSTDVSWQKNPKPTEHLQFYFTTLNNTLSCYSCLLSFYRYFLTSFYTKYDPTHFFINTASLLSVLIPKLPQLHGVRIFGINKYWTGILQTLNTLFQAHILLAAALSVRMEWIAD